ncbi:MAG: 16S rRNA (guanine(527)-N(7))-methyltransferase RsmG [Bacteroidota bacterium]|nr:16S rRNA (guanine(527)-N(7))-methyltransferase RsmG [Bacteroidota bacterium]
MNEIIKYFPDLTDIQKSQFKLHLELFTSWNEKINLVSRKDIDNLEVNHVLHSLAIAKVLNFAPGTEVLDVGTGGGFPGLPLAILFPEVGFTLVDGINKKVEVVKDILKELKLENVTARNIRAEELKQKFDFITGRAVKDLSLFTSWLHNKIEKKQKNSLPNGILYLKGGDLEDELKPFYKRAQTFEISDFFQLPYFETKKVVYIEWGQ